MRPIPTVYALMAAVALAAVSNEEQASADGPTPDTSFFEDCVFLSIDIQDGRGSPPESISEEWEAIGYTLEDVRAAHFQYHDVAKPNARKVADACRTAGIPLVFVHWGCQFKDGMDLEPRLRKAYLTESDETGFVPHVDDPDNQVWSGFDVRKDEYVLAKTGQDAFPSSNLGFVLENLGAKRLVFVGGHTNPGGCLGQTARTAKEKGYEILCIEDATSDAGESTRKAGIESAGFDFVMETKAFVDLVDEVEMREPQSHKRLIEGE